MHDTQFLQSQLLAFTKQAGVEWPAKAVIEPPKDKAHGDLATNLALVLAGPLKAKPRELGVKISHFLVTQAPQIATAEVAGPGFVNVTFRPDFWREIVPQIFSQADDYGSLDLGEKRKVQIEYVSANPTGPLHIGHGRGAAVGDSLARIMRFAGFDVDTEFYINDAGRQMSILARSTYVRAMQALGRDMDMDEDCYRGEYIKDIATDILKAHPDLGDMDQDQAEDLCRDLAKETILASIKQDLHDFGVEHRVWFSEKEMVEGGAVERAFERLEKADLAYEQDGAFWFKTTELGDDKDRVLRKSDGELTYFASDIAYHANKYDRGFSLCVDIWGADHHGYIPRMRAAVKALGLEKDQFDVVLVQLVNVLSGGEKVKMSKRAGTFETLADVCREVGPDAARFIFLTRKSDSPLDFDLELATQKTMDNPVYYVQYAHARICSVLRKAGENNVQVPGPEAATPDTLAHLDTGEDLSLLRLLARFPDAVEAAANNLSPHLMSYYMQELANGLHRYYTINPVLAAPAPEIVTARLLLLLATRQVLKSGLALLGVSAPESM